LPPSHKAAQAEQGALPDPIRVWLAKDMGVKAPKAAAIEWTDEEAYVSLPRPGGDGWVTFDVGTGAVVHESTSRGPVAYLNDLHKGRDTGNSWRWVIDISAGFLVVISITGLVMQVLMRKRRRSALIAAAVGTVLGVLLIWLTVR